MDWAAVAAVDLRNRYCCLTEKTHHIAAALHHWTTHNYCYYCFRSLHHRLHSARRPERLRQPLLLYLLPEMTKHFPR